VDTDQLGFDGYKLDRSRQRYQGGSMSCSTNDMKSWRNEGTMVRKHVGRWPDPLARVFRGWPLTTCFQHVLCMRPMCLCACVCVWRRHQLHFLEVTFSTTGAFNFTELRLERPRVIYNRNSSQYVMWFYADDFQQSSRLAGIATSQCVTLSPGLHPRIPHPALTRTPSPGTRTVADSPSPLPLLTLPSTTALTSLRRGGNLGLGCCGAGILMVPTPFATSCPLTATKPSTSPFFRTMMASRSSLARTTTTKRMLRVCCERSVSSAPSCAL
jgi:hypothetical protein